MNIALIVAAGTGSRMGNAEKPKQFLTIHNKPLLVHTIEAFQINNKIEKIVIVTNGEYVDQVNIWCKQYGLNKVANVVAGGDSRQMSVYNGLKDLQLKDAKDDDVIVIHDGARPLISQTIINDNIDACLKYDAVGTFVASSDTIIRSVDKEKISAILNRGELFQAQTPQTFKFSIIKDAHERALNQHSIEATDDCQLVLKYGTNVYLVKGSKLNFKITTSDDLVILKSLLK